MSVLLFAASAAHAHAIILSSRPTSGAQVAGRTLPVHLRFNSRIDQERSRLELIAPDGSSTALPLGATGRPDVIAATAEDLKAGSYRLRWQVMSLDGHITRGDIPFDVNPVPYDVSVARR